VNNPYPSRAQLRTEATADRLLAEQEAATATFRAIVLTARTCIDKLHFPLGCPVRGYDVEDIIGLLDEWQEPRDARLLEDLANDTARELAEAA
jgi:hypothetical protein